MQIATQLTTGAGGGSAGSRRPRALLLAAVALALAGLVVLGLGLLGDADAPEAPDAAGEVAVEGDALAPFEGTGEDPAVGASAPAVAGADPDAQAVRIAPGEAPTIVVFVAHWCEVCGEALEAAQRLRDEGALPEEVRVVAVSTGQRPAAAPDEDRWLAEGDWTLPTLIDNAEGHAAGSYGLGAYPYWVFLDAEGVVAGRLTGALDDDDLVQLATELVAR